MAIQRVITYNVNGIRSALGKGLIEWIGAAAPDVLCLQETKAQPDQIPQADFEKAGYQAHWYSAVKKGYSGVGILTRRQPDKIVYGMGIERYDNEGRVIRADYGDISIISVYHPSGSSGDERQDFKMQWLDDFLLWITGLRNERQNLIVCGDFNICHRPIDIHDPVRNATSSGFLPEEREWMSRYLGSGFIDSFRHLNPDAAHQYTWWSFRANARAKNLGWRIDYNMVTANLKDRLRRAIILPEARHSDHCPAVLEIEI